MAAFWRYMRANPQVLTLVLICLILGLGTFLAVLYGLLTSGSTTTDGEPSGLVAPVAFLAQLVA